MIHGLVVVDKEKGFSSHAVVAQIRGFLKTKRVGHFGTLDPAATGILLIGIGHATRLFNFYVHKEKTYSGIIRFGYATSTFDAEGAPVSEKMEIDLRNIDLLPILAQFTGALLQVPPIFSAKKLKGVPLYKYARKNIAVERKPNQIHIHSLNHRIIDPSALGFEAVTSSGTYIRSLAHDIGQKIGVGAFLEELKRERIGEFDIPRSHRIETIARHVADGRFDKVILPFESLLPEFSKIIVTAGGRRGVTNGVSLSAADVLKIIPAPDTEHFRIFDEEGHFLAIARKDRSMSFRPCIVFPDENS